MGKGGGKVGKEVDRLSAKPTYHKPRRPLSAGGEWESGKGLHSHTIWTVVLSLTGPPVPPEINLQVSALLATVTA